MSAHEVFPVHLSGPSSLQTSRWFCPCDRRPITRRSASFSAAQQTSEIARHLNETFSRGPKRGGVVHDAFYRLKGQGKYIVFLSAFFLEAIFLSFERVELRAFLRHLALSMGTVCCALPRPAQQQNKKVKRQQLCRFFIFPILLFIFLKLLHHLAVGMKSSRLSFYSSLRKKKTTLFFYVCTESFISWEEGREGKKNLNMTKVFLLSTAS